MSNWQNDWNAFFSNDVQPGFVHDLGNGSKVTKMGDGTAVYQGPNGQWIPFDKNTNPTFLSRQATGLSQDWQSNTNYQTATNAPAGSQTRLDPAASGFYFDDNGFVTQRRPEGMGGDYQYKFNINDIQDPQVKAYFQANPDMLAAHGASAVSNYSTAVLPRGSGTGKTSAQATPEDFFNNYFHGAGGVGGAGSGGSFGGGTGSGVSGSGGTSAGSNTSVTGGGFPNPFQAQMFDAVTNQVTQNLNRNILPWIRSASTPTGGYGGSRQGVVEANALNDDNQGLSNALAGNLYGHWNNTQNRLLQNKGLDQSFYTAQRGQDLQQTGLGASIFNMGTQGMLGQGQGIYNLGLTAQQAPWQTLTGFTGTSQPYTGYGSTTQNQTGSGAAGFLGGALAGNQLYNIWR